MQAEVFKGRDLQWYWRLRARNGRIIAIGGESYSKKGNVMRAWEKFCDAMNLKLEVIEVDMDKVPLKPAVKRERAS